METHVPVCKILSVEPRTGLRSSRNLKLYTPKAHPQCIRLSGPTIRNNLQPDVRTPKSLRKLKWLYQKKKQKTKQKTKKLTQVMRDYTFFCSI